MVSFVNFETWLIEHLWQFRLHAHGQARFGLHHVKIHHDLLILVHLRHIGAQHGAQFFEDAVDLAALLLLQVKDVVVDVDNRLGFDKGRSTRCGFIVDDASDFALVFSRDTQYPATVAETLH